MPPPFAIFQKGALHAKALLVANLGVLLCPTFLPVKIPALLSCVTWLKFRPEGGPEQHLKFPQSESENAPLGGRFGYFFFLCSGEGQGGV